MSGPFAFSRQALAIDRLLEAAPSWEGLNQAFFPARTHDRFDPGDDMKKVLAAFNGTAEGRRIIEWLCDLTCRAPYPQISGDFQTAALAAKAHEARAAVGYVILRAIADGEALLHQPKEPRT